MTAAGGRMAQAAAARMSGSRIAVAARPSRQFRTHKKSAAVVRRVSRQFEKVRQRQKKLNQFVSCAARTHREVVSDVHSRASFSVSQSIVAAINACTSFGAIT
jgi:ribosome-binding protein aMBF1 (putative translation factor)